MKMRVKRHHYFLLLLTSIFIGVMVGRSSVDMSAYKKHMVPYSFKGHADRLQIRFYGNTTLLIEDTDTAILIDGFFTRPGVLSMLLGVAPNPATVDDILKRDEFYNGVDFVIPLHGHFDHVLDSPYVAERTNAALIGDDNTMVFSRAWAENKICVEHYREKNLTCPKASKIYYPAVLTNDAAHCSSFPNLCTGKFKVSLLEGNHYDHFFDRYSRGSVKYEALKTSRPSFLKYKRLGSHIILLEHPDGTILILGSAAPIPKKTQEKLSEMRIDLLLIGVPGLKKLDEELVPYKELIKRSRVVVPIHWDSFLAYEDFNDGEDVQLKPPLRVMNVFTQTTQSIDWLCKVTSEFPQTEFGMIEFGKLYSMKQLIEYENDITCSY